MPADKSTYRYLRPDSLAMVNNMTMVARGVVEGFIAGLHKSPYKGFSIEFSEHREYVPGDNPRYLDWLVLGRTDRLYIKQFEEETNLRAHLILDTSGSMGYASDEAAAPDESFKPFTKLEYGKFLTAMLTYMMIRQQDSVGLVTFDDQIRVRIPPRSTPTHLNLLMQHLEGVEAGQPTKVSEVFHDLAEYFKKRSLLIIISDLYDEPQEVLKALRHFRHKKHEVVLFHVFDKTELEFPFDRLTDFIDMETNERLMIDPKFIRQTYRTTIDEFIDTYRKDCSEAGIDYVTTDTSVPFDFMLMQYLAKRKRL